MKLFLQKNAKFSSAGGFAPRPPLASGGWRLRPQTPQTAPPIANFWLRACSQPMGRDPKLGRLKILLARLVSFCRHPQRVKYA